jgi:8-oxo-dGTP pyrophosphatase MutT (NUDIX family)
MSLNNYANFQVSLKLIIKWDNKILTLKTHDGFIDFPGGRIDESEVEIPMLEVLKREIAEELGNDIKFDIGKIAFVTKRKYTFKQNFKVLAIYYEADYISGDYVLSDEHSVAKWMEPEEILSKDHKFISKDEYDQLKTYLKT